MKKNLAFSTIFVICLRISFSQTTITGGAVSGNWTKANSPYLIQNAIMIANGTSLTIEPGVIVEFQGSYKFLILGQLLAIGNENDSITFTSSDTTIGWRGIRFDKTATTNDSSKFIYCRFTYGKSTDIEGEFWGGGAFYLNRFSKVIISHSRFSHCYTSGTGGAINCFASGPVISNNLFSYNTAYSCGAISSCTSGNNTIISKNVFQNNSSTNTYSGAVGCWGIETISNNLFYKNISNETEYGGGAIYCASTSSPNIYNNIFVNNSAPNQGGGAVFCYGVPTISNNIFSNNSGLNGGAIYCLSSSPNIINNTFSNNKADFGGAIFCNASSPNISNSILWGNITGDLENQIHIDDESSDPNIYYCDIQGGQSAISIVENAFYLGDYLHNIDTNPKFINPTIGSGLEYDGQNANLLLHAESPCINAGNPTGSYPSFDIQGNSRVVGDTIDIGAYEYSDNISGITENKENSLISLYPNPTSGIFTLQSQMDNINMIEIYSIVGERIYSSINFNNQKSIKIDISFTASGIYYAKIHGGQKLDIITIIKK
jgi:hypothetical protein